MKGGILKIEGKYSKIKFVDTGTDRAKQHLRTWLGFTHRCVYYRKV